MPFPKPKKGEEKDDWMGRCMHFAKKEDGREQDQAVAICLDIWRRKDEEVSILDELSDFIDNNSSD